MHLWNVAPTFFYPDRHHLVAVDAKESDERACKLIRDAHRNLVLPGVGIKKTEGFSPAVESTT
jgi:hypothetical protein